MKNLTHWFLWFAGLGCVLALAASVTQQVAKAQTLGGGGDYGLISPFNGGTITSPISIGTSGPGGFYMQSLATSVTPTSFTTDDAVVGKSTATGAGSGALFFRYDSSTDEGFLGVLSPSIAWRNLRLGAAQTLFQDASGVPKAVLPGSGTNNMVAASNSQVCFSSTTDATGSTDTCVSRSGAAALQINGTLSSTATADFGWTVKSGTNVACNTTCTNACVLGFDAGTSNKPVLCTDATADLCLCAGSS